jgi:hypothetical protein
MSEGEGDLLRQNFSIIPGPGSHPDILCPIRSKPNYSKKFAAIKTIVNYGNAHETECRLQEKPVNNCIPGEIQRESSSLLVTDSLI